MRWSSSSNLVDLSVFGRSTSWLFNPNLNYVFAEYSPWFMISELLVFGLVVRMGKQVKEPRVEAGNQGSGWVQAGSKNCREKTGRAGPGLCQLRGGPIQYN